MISIVNRLKEVPRKQVLRTMGLGAALGLIVILFFVYSVGDPNPSWGPAWRVRPLILTPLVAAFGMLSFFLRTILRPESPLQRILTFLLSLTCCIIALWMGIIIGLDGTLWN
jgi:hypothetical protein